MQLVNVETFLREIQGIYTLEITYFNCPEKVISNDTKLNFGRTRERDSASLKNKNLV